ncbi:GntR family transcriptional regulator [Streptomyces sp. NPDC059134]|uniref:GntR family transcriptional regulator n=1 Tax=Streptomyces sp. NPDC059134 TaxID=3346738 RepID=UPI0036CF3FE1
MAPTALTRQIASRIVDHIRHEGLAVECHLTERALADHLRVSRSPVRSALRLLAQEGVVAVADRGGYKVARSAEQLGTSIGRKAADGDEQLYLRIAEDRLDGRLPDRVTESGLAREYALSAAQLSRILRRINAEGWIERLPGYGWEFQPVLTSLKSYQDSYNFRIVIEPAAILEPTFMLDRAAILEVRNQQQELVDGKIWDIGSSELFDLNRGFHEAVMECSNNSFYIDSLKRINRFRRLIEYRKSLARDRAAFRCREHIEIADLLLEDRREGAANQIRNHLTTVSAEKVSVSHEMVLSESVNDLSRATGK